MVELIFLINLTQRKKIDFLNFLSSGKKLNIKNFKD